MCAPCQARARAKMAAAGLSTPQAVLKSKSSNMSPQDRYKAAIQQFQISKKPVINRK